jgi:hypothetical protein
MHRMGGELGEHINPEMENQEMVIPIANMEGPERIQSCCCTKLILTAYPFGENFMCENCYNELFNHVPIGQAFHHEIPRHFLSGRPARNKVSHCYECGINISELQPATHCIQCVISYNRLSRLEKVLVASGAQIRMVTTYSQRHPRL